MTSIDADAPERDFVFDQGDDEPFDINRENDDGTAKDITGYTFWLTIKDDESDSDGDAAVQKTVTSHTDASNGETTIDLASSDTEDLFGTYVYDIQEKTDNGNINTLLKGSMYFDRDITKSTS